MARSGSHGTGDSAHISAFQGYEDQCRIFAVICGLLWSLILTKDLERKKANGHTIDVRNGGSSGWHDLQRTVGNEFVLFLFASEKYS